MAKKREKGEGNIRKRKDGRWEGRWEGRYTAGMKKEAAQKISGFMASVG